MTHSATLGKCHSPGGDEGELDDDENDDGDDSDSDKHKG